MNRLSLVLLVIYGCFLAILGRLYYWQVIKHSTLQVAAQEQYQSTIVNQGSRGQILTADGHLLVGNQTVYRLFAEPKILKQDPNQITQLLLPLLLEESREYQEATGEAQETIKANLELELKTKLSNSDSTWTSLFRRLGQETKNSIAALDIHGLGFDPYEVRYYPQASMAATVTGFVGKNEVGEDTGYFGLEGALDRELSGKENSQIWHKNALGLVGLLEGEPAQDGRNITLTLRRDVQYQLETRLHKALEQYGAQAGEIIVMDPRTGHILGWATSPGYDQALFHEYEPVLYKNPSVANVFEPGSIFKVLTVAAGIDSGVITADTQCPRCAGPRVVDKYTIKTWNNEYNPDITMTEALAKSDNTAMIYIAEELGAEQFEEYLHAFEIGDQTLADIQEDQDTPFPEKWGPVELATRSFGQGISTTSLQMVRAIGVIANHGRLVEPQIVKSVTNPQTNDHINVEPKFGAQVVSPQTAETVTQMMVKAAEEGEAKWVASKTHTVAGKTGTAQIAVDGQYDPDKTVASFIGFAPAHDPQFVMLVKLVEPQSSIWASETATPLWYQVARQLYYLLSIPGDK